jgi:2-polyprenyl-3-methyl-5-hydroxy-6-metoxy-1,4-benzoquinol methylase
MRKRCKQKRSLRPADARKRRTSKAYDRWSRIWNLARYTNCGIYEATLALLDERHQRVLDVGCGTGLMSAKLAATGRRVVGVDLSPEMIARARRLESGGFDAVIISFHSTITLCRRGRSPSFGVCFARAEGWS